MAKTTSTETKQGISAKKKRLENVTPRKSLQTTSRSKVSHNLLKNNSSNVEGALCNYTHLNVTSFGCDKCRFKCKKLITLKRHQITHIKDVLPILTSYSCVYCDKKFRKFSRLEVHKLKTHKIQPRGCETLKLSKIPITSSDHCENLLKPHKIQVNSNDGDKFKPNKIPCVTRAINYAVLHKLDNSSNESNKIFLEPKKISEDCETYESRLDDDNEPLKNILKDNLASLKNKSEDDLDTLKNMSDDDNKNFVKPYQITDKPADNSKSLQQQNSDEDCKELKTHNIPQNIFTEKTLVNTIQNKDKKELAEIQSNDNKLAVEKTLKDTRNINTGKKTLENIDTIKLKTTKNISVKKRSLIKRNDSVKNNTKNEKIQNKTIQRRKNKAKNEEFVCNICSYKTKRKVTFKIHMVKHSGRQPFTCTQCDFKSCWRAALKNHLKTHSDEKQYTCDECDYKSHQSFNIRRHKKIHATNNKQKTNTRASWKTTNGKLLCLICDFRCDIKKEILNHNKTFHQDDIVSRKELHKCNKCSFKTGHQIILEMHSKTHEKETLICDICRYETSSKHRLVNHFKKHATEMPFACRECKYQCKRKETFLRHSEIHKTPSVILTLYTCKVCNKKFRKYTRLLSHEKLHMLKQNASGKTVSANVECKLCDYKCKLTHDLLKHMRSHTGERPFQCELCPYRATTTSHLTVHMRKHTGYKPCICRICGSRFAQSASLQKHLRNHHDVSKSTG